MSKTNISDSCFFGGHKIPSKYEFHRFYSGKIYEEDFNTTYSGTPGAKIDRIAKAIKYTKTLNRFKPYKRFN